MIYTTVDNRATSEVPSHTNANFTISRDVPSTQTSDKTEATHSNATQSNFPTDGESTDSVTKYVPSIYSVASTRCKPNSNK